ncbi:MAG: DUF3303 domain-containing protein [Dehalococcoidia bacterium]|jgi:hypothetical protein|nr:hypothetical protein [Gemmatimonadota bacterium]MCH2532785.1 DUF3303 domain-containing protein [Dehalococcoidia bacterium]|tara:strand:+ start:461 stop:748 length:288 start_codon:yes stop_codon:yes gene_type:complete
MKFMINWTVHEDKRHEVLQTFGSMTPEDDAAQRGPSMTQIGRWHEPVSGTGVAIVEADSMDTVTAFLLNWNHVCDIEVTPVLDDAETRAVVQSLS